MYLGTSEAIYLAEEMAESVLNGQFSQVLRLIREKELNAVQAMYVMGLICGNSLLRSPQLDKTQINSLMNLLGNHLYDN